VGWQSGLNLFKETSKEEEKFGLEKIVVDSAAPIGE
jgi:hypothetical protein